MEIITLNPKIQEFRLCDHCLGRLFGKFGYGMSNLARGKAIRYCFKNNIPKLNEVQLKKFSELSKEVEVKCELCKNLFDELQKFSELVLEKLTTYEFSNFLIGSKVDSEILAREEELQRELGLEYLEPIKTEINREVGKIVGSKIKKQVNFTTPDITAIIDTRYDRVEVQPAPLFIYGRYRKFVRNIPQTKWPCKRCWGKGCEYCNFTGKIYQTSVEELIAAKLMSATCGEEHFLHGLGREDVDVKMLGSGRPFILEIRNPKKRFISLKEIQPQINEFGKNQISVSELRFTNFKEVIKIKVAKPYKTYRAVVEFDQKVEQKIKELGSAFKSATITQRTPLRVAHRRSDKLRERKVIELKVEEASESFASIIIKAESGLYIKELVSGDEGRTKPNISELLEAQAQVKELDCLGVEYG